MFSLFFMDGEKRIFALVGMAGAGKSLVTSYLQEKHSFPKVYFGEITFDKLKEAGLEPTEENQKIMREKIRSELGMGAYALLSLPKIKKALEENSVVLLESLYSWDEYKTIKKEFGDIFKVIAVCAVRETRFSRIKIRKERALKSWQDFDRRDQTEIEGTDKGGPIAIADYFVFNEGSPEETFSQVDKIMQKEGF